MNLTPLHIKRNGCRLAALVLLFLLAALQSPAQHHGKRHGHTARRLPDSVSTSDEELTPVALDTVRTSGDPGGQAPATDSSTIISDAKKAIDSLTDTTASTPPEPLVLRSISDTAVESWKKDKDFAYANDPSWWTNEPDEEVKEGPVQRFLDSNAFRYTIYILLGSLLLYALYRIIAENNLRFFYKKPSRLRDSPQGEADLPEEDLELLLQQALREKHYRMATRLLYLKTLHLLDARQLIHWHSQATDEEYVRQMSGSPQGAGFRWLTGIYERVWYGKFSIDDQQFSRLLKHFQEFHTTIDHGHA